MEERKLPKLRVSRKEAREKIDSQIKKGQQLRNYRTSTQDELLRAFGKWSKYNENLLLKLFDTPAVAEEYNRVFESTSFITVISVQMKQGSLSQNLDTWMNNHINHLKGICEQLELYEEPSDVLQDGGEEFVETMVDSFGNEVFIVYGHDEAAKHAVARFVKRFDIEPIILDEQPDQGQTIIEKFEDHADETGFAIVLLTPDDVGESKEKANEPRPRARQNVILELGYFLGKLGRERVCVLYNEGVELPSDIHGILYVPMNNPHEWKLKLAQEMDQAGIPVDLNNLK